MEPQFIMKCVSKQTKDSINGPINTVTLVPHGPLNTATGEITFFVHYKKDDELWEVGKQYRFTAEPV